MELKSAEAVLSMLRGKQKIVLLGDSGCAQLCEVGGILQLEDMQEFLEQNEKEVIDTIFIEGGICNGDVLRNELAAHKDFLEKADVLLIQACGVAVQVLTELIPEKESFPATDSKSLGFLETRHVHHERCVTCGDCILHLTGGICPYARCAKGILNGPCGGAMNGRCERDENTDCAWQLIYDRLKMLGKLDNIRRIWDMRDWSAVSRPLFVSQHVLKSEVDKIG